MSEGFDFLGGKSQDPGTPGPDDLEAESQEIEEGHSPQNRPKPPRPLGVTILMVLHGVGGLIMVGLAVYGILDWAQFSNRVKGAGVSPLVLMVNMLVLPCLLVGSAVGMFSGARWGWWFAAFYYFYSIVRSLSAIWLISQMAAQVDLGQRGPGRYYLQYTGRSLISLLLLLYFFRDKVRQYFDMLYENKFSLIVTMLGVCGTLSAIGRLLGWLPVD